MTNHTHPCRRCRGMLVETYSDLLSSNDKGDAVFVWRCVNCGDYVDQFMLQNRLVKDKHPDVHTTVIRHDVRPLRERSINAHPHMEAA